MKLLNVVSLEDADALLARWWAELALPAQTLPVSSAAGRTLSRDVSSRVAVPPFSRSSVDGYAVRSSDVAAAGDRSPVFLKLVGSVAMGALPAFSVGAGECAYIPTGGALPEGADAVVMIENCEPFPPKNIAVGDSAAFHENVVLAGEDTAAAAPLLPRGTVLRAQELGVLTAAGVETVEVFPRPRVSVFSTGDELVPPQAPLPAGKLYDINSAVLSAAAQSADMTLVRRALLPDNGDALLAALSEAKGDSDVVLVSGGSSQGERDLTERLFTRLTGSAPAVHGLALKPGKPTILAQSPDRKTLWLGLPGHPAAALLVFSLLVSHSLRRYRGTPEPPAVPALAERNFPADPGKTTCVLCRLVPAEDGYLARPVFGKSGLISPLTQADGCVLIPRNREGIRKGERVLVRPL